MTHQEKERSLLYLTFDLALNILIIVILVYLVRTFLISPFQVFGPSMCETLNEIHGTCQRGFGEYLIVNKAVYRLGEPERGDIVVFRPPVNNQDFYIKRIIGLPGEKIKIQNGKIFVFSKEYPKGWELPEPYLTEVNQTFPYSSELTSTFEIPEKHYFVLGDNRKESTDSRTCFKAPLSKDCNDPKNHFVPLSRIEGKAWIVLWPFNNVRILGNPVYASQ